MGKSKAQISVSLDGYMAGPNQSREDGLGEGGEGLKEWVIGLSSWRRRQLAAARFELVDVVRGREAVHLTYAISG